MKGDVAALTTNETFQPLTATLDTAASYSRAMLGGKAAPLAELAGLGFPVPDGVIVTTAAFERFVAEHGLGRDTDADEVASAPIPEDVRQAISEAVSTLGDGPLAVRSSATGEDTEDASAAGQFDSILNVRGVDDVLSAVRRCWTSAFSERVRTYRATLGGHEDLTIAVLVQRMVPAEAAGVAFTANPLTGEDEIWVSAVSGLGERLVSGEAEPDEWVVRGGAASCVTSRDGALDARTAGEVAVLAHRVAAHAGAPQDVEWALADGRVYLLQARPMVSVPTPPVIEPPPGTWIKDTVHYTRPMSPLGTTTFLPRLEAGMTAMCAEFGFLLDGLRQRAIGWELYAQPIPPSGDEVVGERIQAAVEALRNDLPGYYAERWWHGGWREEFQARIETLRTRNLPELSAMTLERHLQECLDLLGDGQAAHFQLFVPYLLAAFDLATTCEQLLGWDVPQTLDLVTGLSEASSEPTRDLTQLAEELRENHSAVECIATWQPGLPVAGVLTSLRAIDPALADRLEAHIARYGCRVPAYDVGDPTFVERPELTLRQLRDLVDGRQADPAATQAEMAGRRSAAEERAYVILTERGVGDQERERFDKVLERARRMWGLREDNLLYTDTMPNGLIRLAALEIGRRLVAGGVLRRTDDAVWLELDELRSSLLGQGDMAALPSRVAQRRAEQAWVRANPGPALHGDPPAPPPPMDELPGEVQHINAAMGWLMNIEFAPAGEMATASSELQGQPGSPGRVTASARVIRDETEFDRVGPGDVLVCQLTTPTWTALFPRASAVVTDYGSPFSHAAIIAREHGIPAVVGTRMATSTIIDGQTVTVDGAAGRVML